jgi:Ribosomal protein L17
VHKLFTELAERYKHRQGGYTRVLQTRQRSNDAAQMAFIECAFTQLHCFNGCWLQCRSVRAALTCTCLNLDALHADEFFSSCRYVDRKGELRAARPAQASLLPASAQAALVEQ